MKPMNPASGTLYHWILDKKDPNRFEDIYLSIEKNQFILVASSGSSSIDNKYYWAQLNYDETYELLEKRDLPLYIGLHTGKTFKQLLCGEIKI